LGLVIDQSVHPVADHPARIHRRVDEFLSEHRLDRIPTKTFHPPNQHLSHEGMMPAPAPFGERAAALRPGVSRR
jgi:hypothetical protein